MTLVAFKKQMDRVTTTYGAKFYPTTRIEQIWGVLKTSGDPVFEGAVNWLIQTHRAPPMVPEFLKAVEHVHAERKQLEREYQLNKFATPIEALQDAAKHNKTADPEFVQLCLKNLKNFQGGKLNREQFISNCDELDILAKTLMRDNRRATGRPAAS